MVTCGCKKDSSDCDEYNRLDRKGSERGDRRWEMEIAVIIQVRNEEDQNLHHSNVENGK